MSEISRELVAQNDEPPVNIELLLEAGIIRYTHKTNYKILPEQYAQWPKFYSIILDSNNKQVVSMEFRNSPNLSSINKVLSLFQANYEYREVPNGENQQVLRITTEGIAVVSYIHNIYYNISIQAAEVLGHVLFYMTEDFKDKTTPTWKQDIAIRQASLSDPYDSHDDLESDNSTNSTCPISLEIKSYKEKYTKLTQEEKELEFRKATSELIMQDMQEILRQFDPEYIKEMSYYEKYNKIEKVFDTPDKCNNYLYQKTPEIRSAVEEMQISMESELLRLFTPSVLAQIGNAIFSDKAMKHVKVAGTGVGAGTSLLLKILKVTEQSPTIGLILDISKFAVSAVYGAKETGLIRESERREIDLHELSQSFSCKLAICNGNNFMNLNHDSQIKLATFYTKFIYEAITTKPHQYPTESYLASNLLERLSNQTYVEKLDLKKEIAAIIETNDGQALTVFDYIKEYNQTTCYEQVLHDLMGQDTLYAQD